MKLFARAIGIETEDAAAATRFIVHVRVAYGIDPTVQLFS